MAKKLKLYDVKKSTVIMTIIVTVICIALAVAIVRFDYLINVISANGVQKNELKELQIYKTVVDILVVMASILGTNLLVTLLIEKKNKNNIVTEFLVNEMLSSESVYLNLSDENQKGILHNIELRRVFDNNEVAYQMHDYMVEKVKGNLKNYYFSECEYVVVVDVKQDYFEKTITHTIKILPYGEKVVLKHFPLGNINLKKIGGLASHEIKDIHIDGKPLKIIRDENGNFTKRSEIQVNSNQNKNKLDNKNGYNMNVKYYLKNDLVLKKDEPIKIVSNFITRCPVEDIVTTFRASVPCKNFSVNYTVEPENTYQLSGSAFGFLDASTAFQNSHKTNIMRFGFDNWIFTDDGVSIVMIKK